MVIFSPENNQNVTYFICSRITNCGRFSVQNTQNVKKSKVKMTERYFSPNIYCFDSGFLGNTSIVSILNTERYCFMTLLGQYI